jgi:antitoxin CptB
MNARTDGDSRGSRLKWRCRRGMRELDAVLQAFLRDWFDALSEDDKSRFERILDLPDPELYAYLARRSEPSDAQDARLLELIRNSLHPQT